MAHEVNRTSVPSPDPTDHVRVSAMNTVNVWFLLSHHLPGLAADGSLMFHAEGQYNSGEVFNQSLLA